MDKTSIKKDLIFGTKELSLVCKEVEALFKIKQITGKEVAEMFTRAFGRTTAMLHISKMFTPKTAHAILSEI